MHFLEDLEGLLAEIDLDEGSLAEQLDRAAQTAVAVFGVDGAGLMLRLDDHGMQLVGASDDTARVLERAQTELEEGPGYDATEQRVTVAVDDIASDDRWPQLSRELSDSRVRGILSAPIWLRRRPAGNFNLLTLSARRWTDAERTALQAFAGVVTALLRISIEAGYRDELVARLLDSLDHFESA
jgi:GAF domain-containing protein